jgi:hypothetical protein
MVPVAPVAPVTNDENLPHPGDRRQFRQLAIQYRSTVDHERALVTPVEAACLAAGQDGCAPHAALILP